MYGHMTQEFNYIKKPIKENFTPVFLRLIIGIILFVWIASIPAYLLVIYMLENGFFSYDILLDGVLANGIFVFAAAIFFLGLTVIFYGFLFFCFAWLYNKFKIKKVTSIETKVITVLLLASSVYFHYILIQIMISLDSYSPFIPFILLSLSIVIFISSYVNLDSKQRILDWKRPLAFLVLSIFIPIHQPQFTSDFVSIGLHIFKVGGAINAEILDKSRDNRVITSGKLLLLSPQFAYLKDVDDKLIVVPLTDQTWLRIWK